MLVTKTEADATPRACVFCGSDDLSREHVLPRWLWREAHGSEDTAPSMVNRHSPPESTEISVWTSLGPLPIKMPVGNKATVVSRSLTVKVVCRECNHGWMSRLEAAAQVPLRRMFYDNTWRLDKDEVRMLQRWAAKTALMNELAVAHPRISTPAMLDAVRDDTELPGTWHFAIARPTKDIEFEVTSSLAAVNYIPTTKDRSFPSGKPIRTFPYANQAVIVAWRIAFIVRYTPHQVIAPASLWHDLKRYPVGSPPLLDDGLTKRRRRTRDLPRIGKENLEDLEGWTYSTRGRMDAFTCVENRAGERLIVSHTQVDKYHKR